MNAPLGITGERYGRWVAVRKSPSKSRQTRWIFRCDCGIEKDVSLSSVRGGSSTSCGCYREETAGRHAITHGHSAGRSKGSKPTREYISWASAKSRCIHPYDPAYPRYGGRGVSMCPQWITDFSAFLAYMGPRPPGTSLDRKDGTKGYEPGNCRWATPKEQCRNRKSNVFVKHEGRLITLTEYADFMGVGKDRLSYYMRKRGFTAREAAAYIISGKKLSA